MLLGSLVFMAGCPASRGSTDAAVDDAGVDASVAIVDAGPPPPADLEPGVTVTQKDGGTVVVAANAQVEDAIALTVVMPARLKDFRLRLMDWTDKVVVSDDALQADGVTWVLTPAEPLKSGRDYTLKLDAELGPVITDEAGGTWNDWELSFHLAGEIAPEPTAKKPLKKRK